MLRDLIFLPYYLVPNFLGSIYTFRKYLGSAKILIYFMLPILNILLPLYNVIVSLVLRSIDDEEENEDLKTEELLISEIINEELEKPLRPKKEDFAISDRKLKLLEDFKKSTGFLHSCSFLITGIIGGLVLTHFGVVNSDSELVGSIFGIWIGCLTIVNLIYQIVYSKPHKEFFWNDLINSREDLKSTRDGNKKYKIALMNNSKKVELIERVMMRKSWEYWFSKNGPEFEDAVAQLCLDQGYEVYTTPKTGDKGVDLFLERDGKTMIIQCKSYKKTIGPKVVRELYGTLMDVGTDKAILAAPRGFTRGVYEFVKDKPIELWDVDTLAEMAYDYEGYINYELANAKDIGDIKKYMRRTTGMRI